MTTFDIYLDKLVNGETTDDNFPKNESTWEELFSFGKRCIDEIVALRRKDAENEQQEIVLSLCRDWYRTGKDIVKQTLWYEIGVMLENESAQQGHDENLI